MTFRALMSTACIALLIPLAGCWHESYDATRLDQPWAGPGERAKGTIDERRSIMGVHPDLIWTTPSRRVSARRAHDLICQSLPDLLISADEHPVFSKQALDAQRVLGDAESESPWGSLWTRVARQLEDEQWLALSVVCVAPLVVVVDGTTIHCVSRFIEAWPLRLTIDGQTYSDLFFPKGLTYGTTFDRAPSEMQWCAPEASTEWRSVDRSPDGVWFIPTKWGRLTFVRDETTDGAWRVIAESSNVASGETGQLRPD